MTSIARGAQPSLGVPERQQMLAELSNWRVTTIIVGPMAYRDRMVAFLSWLFERPPMSVADVQVWTLPPQDALP
jgi:hypothetical protein